MMCLPPSPPEYNIVNMKGSFEFYETGSKKELLPGDVLCIRDDRYFNRMVRKLTHSPVGHVAIIAFHNNIVEATPMGVRLNPITVHEKSSFHILRSSNARFYERMKVVLHAKKYIGDPYDIIGSILAFLRYVGLWVRYRNMSMENCTELVVRSYKDAGIPLDLPSDVEHTIPDDFLNTDSLQLVGTYTAD